MKPLAGLDAGTRSGRAPRPWAEHWLRAVDARPAQRYTPRPGRLMSCRGRRRCHDLRDAHHVHTKLLEGSALRTGPAEPTSVDRRAAGPVPVREGHLERDQARRRAARL